MPIDVLVFGELALRADLIEAIQKADDGSRIVLTTGREYRVPEDFSLVVRVMKSMTRPQAEASAPSWSTRHSA